MYVISQDKQQGFWYCHMQGYNYIPVFGSIGDKKKAQEVCNLYNKSIGAKKPRKCHGADIH